MIDKVFSTLNNNLAMYASFRTALNVTLPGNNTSTAINLTKCEGNLDVVVSNNEFIIPTTGLYFISASFVFAETISNGVVTLFDGGFTNRTGQTIRPIAGKPNNFTALMKFNAGDKFKFVIENRETSNVIYVGSNNNVNYLLIKRVN